MAQIVVPLLSVSIPDEQVLQGTWTADATAWSIDCASEQMADKAGDQLLLSQQV